MAEASLGSEPSRCRLRCFSKRRELRRSWEGRSYSDLVARWGPPNAILSDGKGGQTVVYVQEKEWTTADVALVRRRGSIR